MKRIHLLVVQFALILLVFVVVAAPFNSLASTPGDEHWDKQFGPVGVSDPALAIAVSGSDIFVGGLFTSAGNTKANGIARFDGTNWSNLGNGISGNTGTTLIYTLSSDGTNLYAGGGFTNVDGLAASNIARWNGKSWFPLGGGISGYAVVTAIQGSNLYVGGAFAHAGGQAITSIARWDGQNWFGLGTGLSGGTPPPAPVAYALALQGSDLYVGGNFTSAGGVSAASIARWDGSSWHALGAGLNGTVGALVFYGPYLYAGGGFTNSGLGITNLAKWDGANWSAVGLGTDLAVEDLKSDGTNLYVTGLFTRVDTTVAKGIASWNGSNWLPLGTGLGGTSSGGLAGPGIHLALRSNQVYVAGNFGLAGSVGASHVAGWDGTNWFSLGGGTSKGMTHLIGIVRCLQAMGTDIYAGGLFTQGGETQAAYVARWDGAKWFPLGTGLAGGSPLATTALSMAHSGNTLYVGGAFSSAGGVSANGIASWDGASWSALGTGINSNVIAVVANGSDLYAGGQFTNAGGVSVHGIARWDGFAWNDVNGGVTGGGGIVDALAADGTYVYASGNFTKAGSTTVANIARWDGANWTALGPGLGSTTVALAFGPGGVLYAGGSFTTAGGAPANRIAKWDGTSWTALGGGLGSNVVSIAVNANGTVYAGGVFTNASGLSVVCVARWDGTNWSAMGSGLTNAPLKPDAVALCCSGNDVFVGGQFLGSGDKPAFYFARWNDQLNFYPPPQLQLAGPVWLPGKQFKFRVTGTSGEQYTILGSTNLSGWSPLLTNSAPLFDFTDTTASNYPARYYRAMLGP